MLARVAAEILEGALVRLQELRQGLVQAGLVVTTAAEAEREYEDVPDGARVAEGHPRLAPIDLALPPRRRLEPDERPLGRQPQGAQGADEELHRLVAALIAALAELLKQDLRRVIDLLGALPQILSVRCQQRVRPRRPVIRLPRCIAQAASDGLAIQVQAARNLGDRHPLGDPQAAHLLPPLPADHRHLLAESDLCADGRGRPLHLGRHFDSLLLRRVGKFQLPQVGSFALPLTRKPREGPGQARRPRRGSLRHALGELGRAQLTPARAVSPAHPRMDPEDPHAARTHDREAARPLPTPQPTPYPGPAPASSRRRNSPTHPWNATFSRRQRALKAAQTTEEDISI